MYAITGITGQVGGAVARALLAAGKPVRAVVRDLEKGRAWAERGCEVVVADIEDAPSLTSAFQGVEGAFVLMPSSFDPMPGFPEAQARGETLRKVLEASRPGRVVYLSTIGAQASESNLLTQHTIIEKAISGVPMPVTFLRPAWYMENAAWDVAPARDTGVIPSFLQPLDKLFPMVATEDIGQLAASLIVDAWAGHRVVEIEGAKRISPNDVAATFASLLGRPVHMEIVPRASWESLFTSQGMKNPLPRIRMVDGFNEGWIEFERPESERRKGSVSLESVLKGLIER